MKSKHRKANLTNVYLGIFLVSLILFILISFVAPFRDFFGSIFPKSPSRASSSQSFGVNDHLMWQNIITSRADLDRIKADGLQTIRFDLSWKWLEPDQKGVYDRSYLTKFDQTMEAISQRGLQPIVVLLEVPTWARKPSCATRAHCPPANFQNYADTYAFLAARYLIKNPNVVWEVWNEPNLTVFWASGPNATEYTDLLKKTYTSIKQVAPDAKVIGGVIAFNDQAFLEGMYQAGAKGYFDGLDLHPYARGHPPEDVSEPFYSFKLGIEQMAQKMASWGEENKPIYLTEFGWDSATVLDENLRASYYQKAVQMIKSYPNVVSASPYIFKEFEFDSSGHDAALVSSSGQATPAWTAYVTEVLKVATPTATPQTGNGGDSGGGSGGGSSSDNTNSGGGGGSSPALAGDLNGNGRIDILDVSIMLRNWNKAGQGDLDNNGTVNILDVSILLRNWGR